MLQAARLNGFKFDVFPFSDDSLITTEIDVSGCDVVNGLMIPMIVVIFDKLANLLFQITWQIIVFQENTVLHRLVPSFDLALRLRMVWSATCVLYAFSF